jgi:hypothetical protein
MGYISRFFNLYPNILKHECTLKTSAYKLLKLNIHITVKLRIILQNIILHVFIISYLLLNILCSILLWLPIVPVHNVTFWPHTLRSQHSPVAHEAFTYSIHVDALQQGLSQCPFIPQSHCSPASTNPFPHTGLSNRLTKKEFNFYIFT